MYYLIALILYISCWRYIRQVIYLLGILFLLNEIVSERCIENFPSEELCKLFPKNISDDISRVSNSIISNTLDKYYLILEYIDNTLYPPPIEEGYWDWAKRLLDK